MNAAYAHCDVAIAARSSSVRAAGHPNWLIATTVLASGLAFVDGSVVNVGLPAIGATSKGDKLDVIRGTLSQEAHSMDTDQPIMLRVVSDSTARSLS
jgi:hypothetical protein